MINEEAVIGLKRLLGALERINYEGDVSHLRERLEFYEKVLNEEREALSNQRTKEDR
jgi:hypothetical protein